VSRAFIACTTTGAGRPSTTPIDLEDADWVFVGMPDVLVADAMFAALAAMTRSTPTYDKLPCHPSLVDPTCQRAGRGQAVALGIPRGTVDAELEEGAPSRRKRQSG
jgi:hypothetical protein